MTYKDVLRHFGSQAAVAESVGVTLEAVKQWQQRNQVPKGRQWQLQVLTSGKLRAANK